MKEAAQLALVEALADGDWHSGETLALRAGVTRAAVAKRVARLADWGLQVEARHRLGYRLVRPLERLQAAPIQAALGPAAAARLRQLDIVPLTDSTNERLLAADARHDPQAVLAEFQSAGRGRQGRRWVSPFGANLYLSLAWTFPQWPPQLTALPLVVGLACAEGLDELGLHEIRLKWPNDLWVRGRKLGGILIEHRGEASGPCRAVIGLGLNVHMDRKGQGAIDQPWISLAEAMPAAPSRNALAGALLARILEALDRFQANGFTAFRARWARYDLVAGRRVRVLNGGDGFEGEAAGIDATGALQVRVGDELRRVLAGDVSLRPA